MEVYDVVMKLVGPVRPVGETHTDNERFDNLEKLTELVSLLVEEIDYIAMNNESRDEFSRKRAGKHCAKFLADDLGIGD